MSFTLRGSGVQVPQRPSMISIIYEDKDIIAVNKPAGLVVHPDKIHKKRTLIQEIIKLRPEIKDVGDSPIGERPGIVHRLDKDTSGVLIVAKNQSAFEHLKSQFKDRKIIKKYIALVEGEIKNNSGVINLPIGKSKSDFRKKLASEKAKGELREAVTEYRVLEKFADCTLLEAYPQTGRTHQIRAHFKAIDHPVVCDPLY
ncbi:MAG: RluA family pseudouridine synthase, partial [Patescibacteria group bacterium]